MSNEQETQHTPQGDINQPLTPQEIDSARALLPAYAIDAVDIDERAFVQRALAADDSGLSAELADYDLLAEALLLSVEQVAPPPDLRQKLMNAAVPGSSLAAAPSTRSGSRLKTLFITPDTGALRYAPLAAILALVLLVGSNLFWLARVNMLNDTNTTLTTRVDSLDTMIRALWLDDTSQVQLASTSSSSGVDPSASVFWAQVGTQELWIACLYTNDLPPLETGRVYQLWLVHSGTPLSFGTFTVDSNGQAVLIFNSSQPIGQYDSIGVTVEPEGGSDSPTTTPVMRTDL